MSATHKIVGNDYIQKKSRRALLQSMQKDLGWKRFWIVLNVMKKQALFTIEMVYSEIMISLIILRN